jgi:aryl-alcohol dehydrogenase-like predicted oxidoreductase
MGGCPMGGYNWGQVCDTDSVETIHFAIDEGITIFDTADIYGLGHSEEVLGKTLGDRRKEIVIATKFGVRYSNGKSVYDNSPEYIEKAIIGSLKRLRTDYIDLYQIHYRDETSMEIVVNKLLELRKRGLIRFIGLSNIYSGDIEELIPFKNEFVSFQNEYSLATRKNEATIQEINTVLEFTSMTWGSLGQGILTGKYTKDTVFDANDRRSKDIYVNFHGEKLLKNLKIVEVLKEIALDHSKSIPATAIRFILDYLKNSVVLVGIKNLKQLHSNLEAVDWKLSSEDIKQLLIISDSDK